MVALVLPSRQRPLQHAAAGDSAGDRRRALRRPDRVRAARVSPREGERRLGLTKHSAGYLSGDQNPTCAYVN